MKMQDEFAKFETKDRYTLVDSTLPFDLFIGLDRDGRKTIKLRSQFEPIKVNGTEGIDVMQYKSEKYSTLQFSLCVDDIVVLFYHFCDDIYKTALKIKDPSSAYQIIVNRFYQWKRMFHIGKFEFMSEPQIMGLIGEVLFLKNTLFDKYGVSNALRGWSGQQLTHKDFSYDETWYESKAVSKSASTIKISSIEQLTSNIDGYVAIHFFERMSPAFNGVTLNALVKEVLGIIPNKQDQESFYNKVSMAGYIEHDYYDEYVYAITDCRIFEVGNEFPRLTKDGLPSQIVKANYEIDIKSIIQFEVK